MLEDTTIWVAIITGVFALGVAVGKAYFDRKQSRQAQLDTQSQKALYLFGKIESLLDNREESITKTLREFSDEINMQHPDPAFLAGIVGYLEIELARVESISAERKELEQERIKLQHKLRVFLTIFLYSFKVQFDGFDGTAAHITIALMRPLGIVGDEPLVEVRL